MGPSMSPRALLPLALSLLVALPALADGKKRPRPTGGYHPVVPANGGAARRGGAVGTAGAGGRGALSPAGIPARRRVVVAGVVYYLPVATPVFAPVFSPVVAPAGPPAAAPGGPALCSMAVDCGDGAQGHGTVCDKTSEVTVDDLDYGVCREACRGDDDCPHGTSCQDSIDPQNDDWAGCVPN